MLKKGFNLTAFPSEVSFYSSFDDVTQELVGVQVIDLVFVFDPITKNYQIVRYDESGQYLGQDFPIKPGKGYIINAAP